MRPRSLSVAVDRHDIISKKFEGVASDENEEVVSDSDDPDDDEQAPEGKSDWTSADYKELLQHLRAVLPNSDKKKAASRLKSIEWSRVAFGNRSADEVKEVTCKLIEKVRKYRTLGEMLDDVSEKTSVIGVQKKPKYPPSAYNFYVKANLRTVKQEHPELSQHEILRKVAEQFKQLPDKKKQKYEQLAEQAKEEYKKELDKFYIENPDATPKKKTAATKKKAPKKPTKITPYNLFVYQKKLEGLTVSNADMKKLWEITDFEQKVKFIREAYSSEKSKLTKSEKDLLDIAHGKPEVVPRSTSEYFLKKYATKDPSIPPLSWRKGAMAEFRELPKIRKLELELELRRAQAEFVTKYRAYIEKLPLHEKQPEIDLLQQYLQTTMEKEQKLKYDGGDLTGCGGATSELTDLPLAESTTNDIEPRKKKSNKKVNAAELPPPSPVAAKPLKSILKSPAPKHKLDEPEVSTTVSRKKKKSDPPVPVVESESDSSYKKGKKKPKKEKDVNNGVDSDRGADKNGSNLNRFAVQEPKRPPKDIVKYYKKFHYFGKAGKHKESFEKLSAQRKKTIEEEMRAAQKKYMIDLKKYLDHLPKSEVKAYVTHLKEFVNNGSSADERETDEEEVEEPAQKSPAKKNTTKQEPSSGSSEDDSDEY